MTFQASAPKLTEPQFLVRSSDQDFYYEDDRYRLGGSGPLCYRAAARTQYRSLDRTQGASWELQSPPPRAAARHGLRGHLQAPRETPPVEVPDMLFPATRQDGFSIP
jgi:hypothetical protein